MTDDERDVLQAEEDSRSHAADETLWSLVRDAFRYRTTGGLRAAANSGFWGQPKDLRETIITLCIAAVVQGWNQTATNGANLTWWQDLGQHDFSGDIDACAPKDKQAWIFALINAATYLAASLVGCWISDWVSTEGRNPQSLPLKHTLCNCLSPAETDAHDPRPMHGGRAGSSPA